MNYVLKIAQLLDPPAYTRWSTSTLENAEQSPFTTEQLYRQAVAENRAVIILKNVITKYSEEIHQDLVEFEIQGWFRLGIGDTFDKTLPNWRDEVKKKYPYV